MHYASEINLQAAKHVVTYIKGTIDFDIKFKQVQNFHFHGFSDSDQVGYVDDMRSISSYCFSFGSGFFSWCSKKQDIVAQSTTEVEYIVAAIAANQALWIRKMLTNLNMEQTGSTQVFVDNQAAISIASNPVFHGRTKHFKIKFYFLREIQQDGEVNLLHCKTEVLNVDILTKALLRARFEFLKKTLGVCCSQVKEEC